MTAEGTDPTLPAEPQPASELDTFAAEERGATGTDDTVAADTERVPRPAASRDAERGRGRYRPLADDGESPGDGRHPVIGAGGVGRVLGAFDTHLHRPVALKELLTRDGAGTERFLREARVTATLQHPSIVPIYELAEGDDGAPYYTMKMVRGRTLADAIAGCETQAERLALLGHFEDLCQGLAYAHRRGVVHRDVKPANVMVGEFGETVVLDWGLAKIAGQGPGEDEDEDAAVGRITATDGLETVDGSVMGTPAYMSPEQARGEVEQVDARSDTWALGLVLYELLSGERALGSGNAIAVLARAQAGEVEPLATRAPDLPAELIAIVDRALRRAPDQRYPDAGALAADIVAFRTGALVGAHSYGFIERVRRFVARYRHAVAVAGVAAVVMTVGGASALVQIIEERDRARAAKREAERERGAAQSRAVEAQRQRELAEQRREQAVDRLADSLVVQARLAWADGRPSRAWLLAAEALSLGERADARGLVLGASRVWTPRFLGTRDSPIACTQTARDPTDLVVACADGSAVALLGSAGEATTVELPALPNGERPTPMRALAVGPEGATLAVATEWGIAVYDVDAGRWRATAETSTSQPTSRLAFSPDGARLFGLAGRWDVGERLTAWDSSTGAVVAERPWKRNTGLDVAPDGSWLVVATHDGVARLDAQTLATIESLAAPGGSPHGPKISPDGRRIAVANHDGGAWLLHPSSTVAPIHAPGTGGTGWLHWTADGSLLVDAREDRSVRVLDGDTGAVRLSLPDRPLIHGGVMLAPGGEALWIQHGPKQFREWDLQGVDRQTGAFGRPSVGPGLAHSSTARLIATTANDAERIARVWREDGVLVAELGGPARAPKFSPDGGSLYLSLDGRLVRFDTDTWAREDLFELGAPTFELLGDDSIVATVERAGELSLRASEPGADARILDLPSDNPWPRALADGDLLTISPEALMRVDLGTGAAQALLEFDHDPLSLRLSEDAGHAMVGFTDGWALVYDIDAGVVVHAWQAHDRWTARVAVSNDGGWAATASKSAEIRLWSLPDGEEVAVLAAHDQRVLALSFDAAATTLVTTDSAGVLWRWDVARARTPADELLAEARARFGVEAEAAPQR